MNAVEIANKKMLSTSDVVHSKKLFVCNNCEKEHRLLTRVTKYGNVVLTAKDSSKPYRVGGLEDKLFCNEYCAIRYIVKQECDC